MIRPAMPVRLLLLTVAILFSSDLPAQEAKGAREREFAFSLPAVKAALQNIGAYTGQRLPSLEGFVQLDGLKQEQYQHPYLEYKIELVPHSDSATLVHLKANVSAWYSGAEGQAGGYRTLESNGRLERDLLDRLDEYLKDKSDDPNVLTRRIAELHAQRLETERHLADLQTQLRDHKSQKESPDPKYVSVTKANASVFAAPSPNAKVLLRAEAEDEFRITQRQGKWVQVQLDDDRTGWLQTAQVQMHENTATAASGQGRESAPPLGFTIIREMPSSFSGDWPPLKGKDALFVWVRPEGSSLNVNAAKKLRFAQEVFIERYREVSHSSQSPVAGIVVIFLDQRGGVAAASLNDIGLWADGTLTQQAFLRKCSLDPPSVFVASPPGE